MSCMALLIAFLQLHQFGVCCVKIEQPGWFTNDEHELIGTWVSNEVYVHYLRIDDDPERRASTCVQDGKTYYVHDWISKVKR